MIQLSDCQIMDLERLAQAIAASFHQSPRAWLSQHGGICCIAYLPKEYRHLVKDYKETKKEMEQCLK